MGKGQIPPHAFEGKGIGLKSGETPTAVRFPKLIKETLDAMGSSGKQDFIRAAVMEKLEREALLPSVAIAPPSLEPTPEKKIPRETKPLSNGRKGRTKKVVDS